MHFLFSVDDVAATDLAVSVVSILKSLQGPEEIFVHVISADLTQESKTKFEALNDIRLFNITYYDDMSLSKDLQAFFSNLHNTEKKTFFPFFAPDFLNGLEKVFYIEAGTLVRKDLSSLWRTDVSEYSLAAVEDSSWGDGRHLRAAGFVPERDKYFYTSLCLFNLEKMRSRDVQKEIFLLYRKYKLLFLKPTQDMLNLLYRGQVLYLAPKYNLRMHPVVRDGVIGPYLNDPSYHEAYSDPCVVHFDDRRVKPWQNDLNLPFSSFYQTCLKQTAWKNLKKRSVGLKDYVLFYCQKVAFVLDKKFSSWIERKILPFFYKRVLKKALAYNESINYQGLETGQAVFIHGRLRNTLFFYLDKFFEGSQTLDPSKADAALLYGLECTKDRYELLKNALQYKLPLVFGEDGFVHSYHLGALGDPSLSCLFDHTGAYYDARGNSLIETFLNSEQELSDQDKADAKDIMRRLVAKKLSKYNMLSPREVNYNEAGQYKSVVLVVDQRYGDQSISYSLASSQTFKRMLEDAIRENPDSLILIRTHPDGDMAHHKGHYSSFLPPKDNIKFLNDRLNPISLIQAVDTIYVVSSLMGFEGLLCGKKVICYGAPFYSGWGLTGDRGPQRVRKRSRNFEDLFYAAYIKFAKYVDPETLKPCSLPVVLDYILEKRDAQDRFLKKETSRNLTAIVSYSENSERFFSLLDSLRRFYPTLKIIVVDIADIPLQHAWDDNVRYIRADSSVNCSKAWNIAVNEVRTTYTLMLQENFVFTERTALEDLLAIVNEGFFELVAGDVVEEGRAQFPQYGIFFPQGNSLSLFPQRSLIRKKGHDVYDFVGNFFIARSYVLKATLWDPALEWGKEIEWSLRLKRRGVRITRVKEVSLELQGSVSQEPVWTDYKRACKKMNFSCLCIGSIVPSLPFVSYSVYQRIVLSLHEKKGKGKRKYALLWFFYVLFSRIFVEGSKKNRRTHGFEISLFH